jgi:hypothetical protein
MTDSIHPSAIVDDAAQINDGNRVAIETVSEIRNTTQIGIVGDYHPFLESIKK